MILVRKHASSLRNYSQQNGICHPDSGRQTAHAFTLMLYRIEDRICFAWFTGEAFRYIYKAFFSLDQESKGKETSVAAKLSVSRWIHPVKV